MTEPARAPREDERPGVWYTRRASVRVLAYAGLFVLLFSLLFIARYGLRGHLLPRLDQECHIGGIAVDLLARGKRFPLLAYAPNEYDNGSFFSGALTAIVFAVFGPSYLALKLVTHAFATAGALAACVLLRQCLDELGCRRPLVRRTALSLLVFGLAFAPRVLTTASMYAVGNHTEGAAIDACLIAFFATRDPDRTPLRSFVFWAVVGFCLYLNKATFLALGVLVLVRLALDRGFLRPPPADEPSAPPPPPTAWRRWGVAIVGLSVGALPEILVITSRHGRGWGTMSGKLARNAPQFPHAFLNGLAWLVDQRVATLVVFVAVIVSGATLVWRTRTPALALIVGTSLLHLAAMTVMAQGGLDRYAIYGHVSFVVLLAAMVTVVAASAEQRWGAVRGRGALFVALLIGLFVQRPDSLELGFSKIAALARDAEGPVCAWRFAEGFGREVDHHRTPVDVSRESHQIARCRTLTTEAQVLDCIGGIARELVWRGHGQITDGAPPGALTPAEQEAYAFNYGLHRRGDTVPCHDFSSSAFAALCVDAVAIDCLGFADLYAGVMTGASLPRPVCAMSEPPLPGFWRSLYREIFSRPAGSAADAARALPKNAEELGACHAFLQTCYR